MGDDPEAPYTNWIPTPNSAKRISLTQVESTNLVGDNHTVTATITDGSGVGQNGILVTFTVISGPNQGETGTDTTSGTGVDAGKATFTYTGDGGTGTDVIKACYTDTNGQEVCSQTLNKVWNPPETPYTVTLEPETGLNLVGVNHTLTATVADTEVEGLTVTFTVISGPNKDYTDTDTTDDEGKATLTYTSSNGVGTEQIKACIVTGEDQVCSNVVEKEWTEEVINLTPLYALNTIDTDHKVTATIQDLKGNKLGGYEVTFTVVSGPNQGKTGTDTTSDTDPNKGEASWTYTGDGDGGANPKVGTDYIQACFENKAGDTVCTDYDGRVGGNAIKDWQDSGSVCPAIEPNPDQLPDAVKDTPYSQQLTGFGGTPDYTFSSADLPAWLSLSSAGLLSGTPTTEDTYTFTIEVTDDEGCTGTRQYTLHVCPGESLSPSGSAPVPLPGGRVGQSYSQTITSSAEGSTFQMSGYLPPGLSGSEGSYIIQGTPTQTGTWEFTIIGTAPGGCVATQTYTITIRNAEPIPTVTEWGMIILALVLAAISVVAIRRRRMIP